MCSTRAGWPLSEELCICPWCPPSRAGGPIIPRAHWVRTCSLWASFGQWLRAQPPALPGRHSTWPRANGQHVPAPILTPCPVILVKWPPALALPSVSMAEGLSPRASSCPSAAQDPEPGTQGCHHTPLSPASFPHAVWVQNAPHHPRGNGGDFSPDWAPSRARLSAQIADPILLPESHGETLSPEMLCCYFICLQGSSVGQHK